MLQPRVVSLTFITMAVTVKFLYESSIQIHSLKLVQVRKNSSRWGLVRGFLHSTEICSCNAGCILGSQ